MTNEPIKASSRRRTAEVIELRAKMEYAVFTIDNQPERHYFGLAIESSFGGFSYAWSHPGEDFREFLADLDLHYVMGKMVGSDRVFDGEGTTKAIREEIVRRRRAHECTAEEARAEWPDTFDSEFDFKDWCDGTEMFKNDAPWEFHRNCGGSRSREFEALYNLFWKSFAAELRSKLPPGWRETDKDYFEHDSGAVVHKSMGGAIEAALKGDVGDRHVKWRAHISKRYSSMLPEPFDSKEEAMEALAPEIEARRAATLR